MRHKVENLFAKLKDWRRIATRYDRRAHIFLSAVLLGATLIFWLRVLTLGSGPFPRHHLPHVNATHNSHGSL